jgi:hypothetical protein
MNRLYKDCPECGGRGKFEGSTPSCMGGATIPCENCRGTCKVLNLEFIKWMVKQSYGYEINTDKGYIQTPDGNILGISTCIRNSVYLPLLLQRAIEGLNPQWYEWKIAEDHIDITRMNPDDSYSHVWDKQFIYNHYDTIDTAKIDALFYVWEATK